MGDSYLHRAQRRILEKEREIRKLQAQARAIYLKIAYERVSLGHWKTDYKIRLKNKMEKKSI